MSVISPPARIPVAPDGHQALIRGVLADRASIMHLLVAIAVIPAIPLPLFAWAFVNDRVQVVSSSERIEAGFETVARLDAARVAVQTESSAFSLRGFFGLLPLSPAERASVTGPLLTAPAQQVTGATDRQFTALAGDRMLAVPGGRADILQIQQTLDGIRRAAGVVNQAPLTRSSLFQQVVAARQYSVIVTRMQELEQTAILRISQGKLGVGSPALADRTEQVRAVAQLAVLASTQITQLANVTSNPGGKPTADLVSTTGAVDATLETLGTHLSPQLRPQLDRLRSDSKIKMYRSSITDFMHTSSSTTFSLKNLDPSYLLKAGQGSIEMCQQTSRLLAAAVAQGTRQARSDRDAAAGRARDGATLAVLIVAATLAILLGVGGMIRRRLKDLAAAAQRISAGRFEVMDVYGPREVALASQGLNDAVRGLREIAVKAGLIAQGDLSAPALQEPSPGALGAAVHASFERVLTVIREREDLQRRLAHEASHDTLTGLPNRAEAHRHLRDLLGTTPTDNTQIAILFVDLDHFKTVNDTHGHHAGDHVLQEAARRMNIHVRTGDLVCRLGGDEFLIILNNTTAPAAQTTSDRIVQAIAEPITYHEQELRIGASIGIACWPTPTTDPTPPHQTTTPTTDQLADTLIHHADQAVYRAKAAGRNIATL